MKSKIFYKTMYCSLIGVTCISAVHAADFKRFSVSAGWLHVMPQGKANPFDISTSVPSGTKANVGQISIPAFMSAVDPEATLPSTGENAKDILDLVFKKPEGGGQSVGELLGFVDSEGNVTPVTSGVATINGIDHWQNEGSGLEADDVDTLGLTFNYYLNENVSLQFIGGIPPKVDINGKGFIKAPLTGSAAPGGLAGSVIGNNLGLKKDIPITNLDAYGKAATVRAWTPALEAQYQWGRAGINKFRPYVGAGVMYAHFSDIKLNSGIRSDLEAAGHMIQNIHDRQAGAALDGKKSSANPVVDVDADDAIAPIVTAGFTYDITPNWYTVASVSYAKLNNKATINVFDRNTNKQLIHATTKMDIDPIITYLGGGYRF